MSLYYQLFGLVFDIYFLLDLVLIYRLAIDTALGTIDALNVTLKISWVRGHDGNKYNEKCDKLAHGEYKKLAEKKGADEI